jgi:hypothetical protein
MNRLSLVLALALLSTPAFASDHGWLNVNNARLCWNKLGDSKLNFQRAEEFDRSELGIETMAPGNNLAIIHSSNGTTVVDKNGSCNYDPKLTADIWASKRLEGLVKRIEDFIPQGSGFIGYPKRADGSANGSEYLSKDELQRQKDHLLDILQECAQARGSLGETARAAIKNFRSPASTGKASKTVQ